MTAAQSKFHELLRTQIRNEFTASQQYTAVAVHCYDQDLPQLAAHFYAQALEERNHAMGMVQYLLGLGITMSLASIASWVAFGPGPRQFGGSGTFGGGAVSETLGRAVFGLGAGLTWLFVITLGVVGLRRLGRR